VILTSFVRKPRDLLDDFELNFWSVPFIDTDFSRLFTQTYALFMGLGRWNLVFNSQFRRAALKNRWVPVTTAETLSYRKSIKAFASVRLRTRLLCWDEKRFYLEQTFFIGDQVHAQAFVQGLIRGPNGHLRPTEFFQALGVENKSPEFPPHIRAWISSMNGT